MRPCMLAVAAALVASSAFAHGPQIQITVDATTSQIVTREIMHDEPYSLADGVAVLSDPKRVYVIPFAPVTFLDATLTPKTVWRIKPSWEQNFGPGLTYGYDQAIGSPTRIFTAGLSVHLDGMRIWDGAAFVDTGMEQIGAVRSGQDTAADTVATVPAGVTLPFAINTSYGANQHSSIRYTLLGDGVSDQSSIRDGIYLLELEIAGTQSSPALIASEPFYFVLHRHSANFGVVSVVNSFISSQGISPAEVQYVPEPGPIVLAAMGLAACLASVRVRQTRRR